MRALLIPPSPPAGRPLRTRALSLLFAFTAMAAPAVAAEARGGEGKKVSGKELVKMGFFQDFAELDLEALLNPEDFTVSIAARKPQPPDQAPGTITVIRSDELDVLGARTLEDALRLVPGVDVTTDGLGRARIVMRGVASGATGGASENVLVLLNGLRLNEDLTGGATAVNLDFPLDHIRQVEILRGPGAALYGDGALCGVINLVSSDNFEGTEVAAGGGSFTSQQYTLRSAGPLKGIKISGFVRFDDTHGARLPVPVDTQTLLDQASPGRPPISLAPGRTTDDRRALEASYRFAYADFGLAFRVRNESSGGLVGPEDALGKQNDLNDRQISLALTHRRSLGEAGTLDARLLFTQSEIRYLLEMRPSGYRVPTAQGGFIQYGDPGGLGGAFLQTRLNTRRYGFETQWERGLGTKHDLQAGVGLERVSTFGLQANGNVDLRTDTPLPITRDNPLSPLPGLVRDAGRTVLSLRAQDVWTPSPHLTVTAGLRYDDVSDVGGTLNPRVALVGTVPAWLQKHLPAALAEGLGYKLLYGRSFRMPTFSELDFDLPGYTANPNLSPAVADSLEAALSFRRSRLRLSANGFLNLVRDTIVPEALPGVQDPARIVNAPGVRVLGLELAATGGLGVSDSFFVNYTYQHARDRATDAPAPDQPTHLANLGAIFNVRDRWSITPAVNVRSSRPRAVGDPRPAVAGYALFNLNLRARNFYKSLEAALSVQNLFGKRYVDPSPRGGLPGDYPRPGRRVLLHVAYRF